MRTLSDSIFQINCLYLRHGDRGRQIHESSSPSERRALRIRLSPRSHQPALKPFTLAPRSESRTIRMPRATPRDSCSNVAPQRVPPSVISTVFESRVRRYGLFESVAAAVCAYDSDSGPFSRGGDSGAAIVGVNNNIVALLIGGAGMTGSSDISYGTPMERLWNQVEFPDALLFFDVPTNN